MNIDTNEVATAEYIRGTFPTRAQGVRASTRGARPARGECPARAEPRACPALRERPLVQVGGGGAPDAAGDAAGEPEAEPEMSTSELLEQARQARRDGDLPECLTCSTAAVAAAEYERDWEIIYHAHACVGRLHMSRAEPDLALAPFRNALDAARELSPTRWLAGAYHDLALALREAGNLHGAKQKAGTAFDLYYDLNPKHPGFTGIVADIAQCGFEQRPDKEHAAHALQAWQAVPYAMPQPRYQMAAAVNQMRSAAVLGMDLRYDVAVAMLECTCTALPHHEHAALHLVHASKAAALKRDYELAAVFAERAELIATGRNEGRVRETAAAARSDALAERVTS